MWRVPDQKDIYIGSVSEMGTRRGLGILRGDMEDRVILNIMDALVTPQQRYLECFVLISLLEVCQEWVVKKGVTWRMFRVPDWKNQEQGHV